MSLSGTSGSGTLARDGGATDKRYAKSGGLSIAYQVVSDGPFDLVLVSGGLSHLDFGWTDPGFSRFLRRLASFSRLVTFDKRGMGLSDPVASAPTLKERMEDIGVVMYEIGIQARSAVRVLERRPGLGCCCAATYPERVSAITVYGTFGSRVPGMIRRC